MERRIKKKYASFIQFFFFFFQYRAIRIKTGKGINPVRINKTLVLVRSFHFSPSITPGFPARNGHRIDSHFPHRAWSHQRCTLSLRNTEPEGTLGRWVVMRHRIRIHPDVEHSVNEFHAFTLPPYYYSFIRWPLKLSQGSQSR